jgi:hypothetical protein
MSNPPEEALYEGHCAARFLGAKDTNTRHGWTMLSVQHMWPLCSGCAKQPEVPLRENSTWHTGSARAASPRPRSAADLLSFYVYNGQTVANLGREKLPLTRFQLHSRPYMSRDLYTGTTQPSTYPPGVSREIGDVVGSKKSGMRQRPRGAFRFKRSNSTMKEQGSNGLESRSRR